MKTNYKRTLRKVAPYQRALERVGAALQANAGGPSDEELVDELRKALFGAEAIEMANESEAKARAARELSE